MNELQVARSCHGKSGLFVKTYDKKKRGDIGLKIDLKKPFCDILLK